MYSYIYIPEHGSEGSWEDMIGATIIIVIIVCRTTTYYYHHCYLLSFNLSFSIDENMGELLKI